MTPLPKRRHSTRRQGKRKASIRLTATGLVACSNCGSLRMPHRVCPNCGFYDGKPVQVKKEKKKKA